MRISQPVGTRWFREAGGLPPSHLSPSSPSPSDRYLSFSEREEIALLRAQGHGVREVARRLRRAASTISRECRGRRVVRPQGRRGSGDGTRYRGNLRTRDGARHDARRRLGRRRGSDRSMDLRRDPARANGRARGAGLTAHSTAMSCCRSGDSSGKAQSCRSPCKWQPPRMGPVRLLSLFDEHQPDGRVRIPEMAVAGRRCGAGSLTSNPPSAPFARQVPSVVYGRSMSATKSSGIRSPSFQCNPFA